MAAVAHAAALSAEHFEESFEYDDPIGHLVIIKHDGSDGNAFPVVAGDVYIGR